MRLAALALLLACASPALSGCETGPRERVVRAQFACDDGRKLAVGFNLDRNVAVLRVPKEKPFELASTGARVGRSYAGGGYAIEGIGDTVTFTAPGQPATRCLETR